MTGENHKGEVSLLDTYKRRSEIEGIVLHSYLFSLSVKPEVILEVSDAQVSNHK